MSIVWIAMSAAWIPGGLLQQGVGGQLPQDVLRLRKASTTGRLRASSTRLGSNEWTCIKMGTPQNCVSTLGCLLNQPEKEILQKKHQWNPFGRLLGGRRGGVVIRVGVFEVGGVFSIQTLNSGQGV